MRLTREAVLDALVERTVRERGELVPRGRTPADRVASVPRALRRELRARPHLIAMVHERGLTERMFLPAQQALVREVHAAGLRGARAASVVRAVQLQAVGHVLVERNRERTPVQSPAGAGLWSPGPAGHDPAPARALARPADPERVFVVSVRAPVGALLGRRGKRSEGPRRRFPADGSMRTGAARGGPAPYWANRGLSVAARILCDHAR
ncbi:TetR/AcrR family transcriptional regulator [Streptomyces sp. NPDC088745]|uniref:TetR/AcrR family transcriptional regulator n=1 Tax=Streptomyces sp. NPDC088745 TaxID=3365884 RepID=UPI003829A3CB